MKQLVITRQHGRSHIQLTATRPYPSSWQQTVIHAISIFDFLLPRTGTYMGQCLAQAIETYYQPRPWPTAQEEDDPFAALYSDYPLPTAATPGRGAAWAAAAYPTGCTAGPDRDADVKHRQCVVGCRRVGVGGGRGQISRRASSPTGCPQEAIMNQWPHLRLDFYEAAVVMSQWQTDGRLTTYPVSVHDVVAACTQVPLGSGLLPPHTLFWGQQGNAVRLGIYVPARCWRVQTETHHYHLPFPPLVFVGCGQAYQVFAVKKRPTGEQTPLYHAPCPNVHTDGTICQGRTPFPPCSSQTIGTALQLFLEGSAFNTDLSQGKCHTYPDDVCQLWRVLDGRKRFPLSELVPTPMRLNELL